MPYSRLVSALFVAILAAPRASGAQCPDGGSPPCTRAAEQRAPRPVPIDRNRIAILPFRVATADTLLGEGFAELLAPEFTGEGGPRAIDMSTTLNAWRRVGGGLRSPLTQDAAARLAREIGAGLLAQGSIVGFGGRLTVSAVLFDATSGQPIGTPARAVGPPDSVETLLRQIATNLLSAAGATTRVREAGRLTTSLPALRAYLEGLALWRRGRWHAAERKFIESFGIDSTFAAPAYQAYMLTSQLLRGDAWRARTIALRERLPAKDRTVVEEFVMPSSGTLAENLARRRQVAERLGDAPEAWFLYGDALYHQGHAVFGPDSAVALGIEAMTRAMVLDPVPVFMYHIMENAVLQRDTAAARRLLEAYERIEGEEGWARSWVLAGFLGDATRLARLRQRGPDSAASVVSAISLAATNDARMPMSLVEDGYRRLMPAIGDEGRALLPQYAWIAQRTHGRPSSADRVLPDMSTNIFRTRFIPWAWMSGDPENDGKVLAARGATPLADSASEGRRLCSWAIVRSARGHTDSVDAGALRPHVGARCANLLALFRDFAATSGRVSDSTLARMDALLGASAFGNFFGYENRLAARMYESRGDLPRAIRAIDYYPRDYRGAWIGTTLLDKGRLALIVGDTSAALRAYDHYLELRAEAEPPYVAERDSVRAIVARLLRR